MDSEKQDHVQTMQTNGALIRDYLRRLELIYEDDPEDDDLIRLFFDETDVLPPAEITILLLNENQSLMISWDGVVEAEPDNHELFKYLLVANREYLHGKFGYDPDTNRVSWAVVVRCSEERPLPFDVFQFNLGIVVGWIAEIFPELEAKGGKRIAVGVS